MTRDKKRNAKKPDPDKRVYTKVYFLLTQGDLHGNKA